MQRNLFFLINLHERKSLQVSRNLLMDMNEDADHYTKIWNRSITSKIGMCRIVYRCRIVQPGSQLLRLSQ